MEPSKISYLIDESLVYGREDYKKRITQLLLSDNHKSGNVTIICVVGADGIGKTTNVQLVYTDKKVEDAFDARIFIGMYENFDEKRLMKEMLESLTRVPCDITDPSILEDIVKNELVGKKLLLVLDSAKNENKSFWDYLLVLLSVTAKGTAVLVNTSRRKVANIAGAMHCYRLGYLSYSDCWLMFQQLAFCGSDPNAQPGFIEIGRHLITKCECNALCIKMLGGLLSCSVIEEEWREVLECDLWDMDKGEREVTKVLRVCYGFLPSHLKQCFVYCSLFPKGYIFSKHYLARLWLAQGFIEPLVGKDIEDVSFQCFEELCSRFFFHHSPLHSAKDDKFIMHELVHDLAQYESRNICFRSEDCMQKIPKDVHHLSFVPSEYQSVALDLIIPEDEDLQSFLVINRFTSHLDNTLCHIIDLVGLKDMFVKLNSLRALDLSNTDIEELPDSIRLLSNLYYLGLSNTKIQSIPEEIGHLINLHTLEAKGCYNLVELPESVNELANLHHLDVTKEAGFIGMPVGIGKLTNLQTLATLNVGSDEIHCGIKELKDMVNLKGCLQICGLENVISGLDAKEANLICKGNLESVSLQWNDNPALIEEDIDMDLQENILSNLRPNENLQELVIRNYLGSQFPLWIGDPSFSQLVSIILDGCPNCCKLPALGVLPALRYLSVQRLYGVETMEVSKFSCLEVLNLWEMYELKEWPEIGNGDFPRLRSLSISRCPMLKSTPRFPVLVELSFHYCPQLPEFSELQSLENLKIEGLPKARLCLSENLIVLKKLEISHCSELMSLEGLSKLTSIEMLKIIQCPKLDVGDWQPNLSMSGDSSKLAFEEELDDHDGDILETKILQNTRQKDLPVANVQLKHEIEEIRAKQQNEKQYTERLKQETWIPPLFMCPPSETRHTTRSTWDSISSFALTEEEQKEGFSSVLTTDGDDTSSCTTEIICTVSPNRILKRKIKSWVIGSQLGSGSFGTVYEAISNEGVFFAIKEVSLLDQGINAQQCISQIEHEMALLSQFEHENIIQYYGTDKRENKLYIFMELMTEGSLASLYQKYNLSDTHVSAYTRQILNGLMYLHDRNIVHRDIKCANILIHSNGSVKLADFGLAEMKKINEFKFTEGSIYWMAPEVVNCRIRNKADGYGSAADIWSLGCTVLEMLTRQIPYHNLERVAALFKIGRGGPPQIPNTLSTEARDFILQCVRVNPEDRPTAVQLLEHPFVK